MKDFISQYDIIYESPARRWENGLPIGNGGLGSLAYAPLHPEWVINKNDVYDYRTAPFKRLKHSQVMDMVAKGKGPEDLAKLEDPSDPDKNYNQYPCPKTCGQIRIRFGHPTIYSPPHRISQRLCLHESTVLFNLDKHLSHPRITSFIHAEQNILAIRVREVSHMVAFNNHIEMWRESDSLLPEARRGAEGDFLWLLQEFPDSFRYAMAAKVVPRGGKAYLDLLRKSVRKIWWKGAKPSEKIESRIEGKYALAPVSGDFDLFLTVVTSLESKDPLREAKKRLDRAAAEGFDSLQRSHRRWWANFWSKSWVELNNEFMNQLWYASVHALGSSVREAPVPGLCGLWYGPMDTPSQILPWRGTYTNDYNAQVPVTPLFRINHPELSESFLRTLRNQLPQVKKDTRQLYGWPGAMYPLSSDPTGREISGGGYRYCQCSGPFWGIFLWWHYLYTKDKKFLEEVSYPVLREIVTFFQYAMRYDESEGRYHLEVSQPPEFSYLNYPDPTFTLAALKYTLKATIRASEILDKDRQKRKRWQHLLEHFPDYPTENGVVTDARGMPANHFPEFDGGLMMTFPCGEADAEVNPKAYRLALRTLKNVLGKHFWSYATSKGVNMCWTGHLYKIGTAALWLGRQSIARRFLRDILRTAVKPSGLITHNWAVWAPSKLSEENIRNIPDRRVIFSDGPIPYSEVGTGRLMEDCTEDPEGKEYIFPALEGPGAYLVAMGETLLQSHNGIIRLFPGLKRGESASFFRLRAEGPVLVSSRFAGGRVRFVRLEGIVKTNVRIKNPWSGGSIFMVSSRQRKARKARFGKYIDLEIARNESWTIAPSREALKEIDSLKPKIYGQARPRFIRFPDGSLTWLGKPLLEAYTGPKRILKRKGKIHP